MSFDTIKRVIDASPLFNREGVTGTERHILLLLADHLNDRTKQCFPSMDRLAYESGYGERTVRRAVTRLRERKILVTSRVNQESFRYRIVLPEDDHLTKQQELLMPDDEDLFTEDGTLTCESEAQQERSNCPVGAVKMTGRERSNCPVGAVKMTGRERSNCPVGAVRMTAEPITNQEGNQELKNKRFRESPDGNSQNRTDQEPGAKTGSDRSCVAAPRGLQNQSQDKNQIPSMGRVCDLPEGVRAEDLPKPGDRQSGEMENISSVGSTSSPTCSAAAAPPPPFTPSALSAMGREPETETARYFLKKLGSPAHLRGRGKSWDDLAAIVEKQIPPYGMALVLDWIFNPKSDGFWAKQIRQRRKDPFEFFFRHLKQIVDQYNVYLDACERTQHPARQQQPEPELELEQEQWQQEELE